MIKTKKPDLKKFFENAKNEITISEERFDLLMQIADTIVDEYEERERVNVNFICTHNSRRSQFSQVWAFFAIEYFELDNIFAYSGGTEVTAFHRNTVKSLQKVGFEFNVVDFSHQNPRYIISFNGTQKSVLGFSKTFDNSENKFPYLAITTCDSADENCPFIPDAIHRFHLPYIDPKKVDGTETQNETYLATSKQIAGELFTIFEDVKNQISG